MKFKMAKYTSPVPCYKYFLCPFIILCYNVQVNSRRLQGLKKLLVLLRSQGLDLEIDSIIGRYHPPPTQETFLDPITLLSLHKWKTITEDSSERLTRMLPDINKPE